MPWDFIANIGQQQNIGRGKSYWLSGPYTILALQHDIRDDFLSLLAQDDMALVSAHCSV